MPRASEPRERGPRRARVAAAGTLFSIAFGMAVIASAATADDPRGFAELDAMLERNGELWRK